MNYTSFILASAKGQNLVLSSLGDSVVVGDDPDNQRPMTVAEYLVNNSTDTEVLAQLRAEFIETVYPTLQNLPDPKDQTYRDTILFKDGSMSGGSFVEKQLIVAPIYLSMADLSTDRGSNIAVREYSFYVAVVPI